MSIQSGYGFEPTVFSLFLARNLSVSEGVQSAIDAGAGGGVLAITLALLGVPRVYAVEKSPLACEVLRRNVHLNGVGGCITVVQSDIMDFHCPETVDLIVSNPPTVPERSAGPAFISGAGKDGWEFVHELFAQSPQWLAVSGSLRIVVSSILTSQPGLSEISRSAGLVPTTVADRLVPVRGFYYDVFTPGEIAEMLDRGAISVVSRGGLRVHAERLYVQEYRSSDRLGNGLHE